MKKLTILILLLLILPFIACDNEPIGEVDFTTDFIFVDSDLYSLITRVTDEVSEEGISCIVFNYPFPLFVFNNNQVFLRVEGINNNEEFLILLESLGDGESISLSYPITGMTIGGNYIEINTNDELQEAIENCQKDEIIGECNGALCNGGQLCAWEITNFNDEEFEGAYLRMDTSGKLKFYKATNVYFGTWTTYFTDDQLYINIQLIDNHDVAAALNIEWKLDYISNELMTLTNGDKTLSIKIDCELPCTVGNYTACQIEGGVGVANFALQEYIICFGYTFGAGIFNPLQFSFYETQQDANSGNNPLSPVSYNNLTNPQTIYFRSMDIETNEITGYGSLIIEAIPCN